MKTTNLVGSIFLIGCILNFAGAYAEELDSSHYQVSNWDPPSDFGWAEECFSDYHATLQCALSSGYNPIDAAIGYQFDVNSHCCNVLKIFDEDCVSDYSPHYDALSSSFSWMRDSCRHRHHHHNPPSSPKPTPSSPTPTPPASPTPTPPTPPSTTPSPPSPTPTPPTPPSTTPSPPSPTPPTPPSTTPSPPSPPPLVVHH